MLNYLILSQNLCLIDYVTDFRMLEYFYDPYYGYCYTIPPKNLKGQALEASEPNIWGTANGKLPFYVNDKFSTAIKQFKQKKIRIFVLYLTSYIFSIIN